MYQPSPGLKLDNGRFDNGPVINALLVAGERINLGGGTAYISSEILWEQEWRTIENGTLRWNGPPSGVMIRYRGSAGRLQQVLLRGGKTTDDRAGYGIWTEFERGYPTSTLHCDQVQFETIEHGVFASATPVSHHTGNNYFADVSFRGVRFPVWSENDQFCPNYFYKVELRTGFEQAFTFKAGGGLRVYGAYVGGTDGATLLWLPDRTQANSGTFEIDGLHVDGTNKNLTLVSHGDVAHRVRISGNVNKGGLSATPVMQRASPSRYANIEIDCMHCHWPVPAKTECETLSFASAQWPVHAHGTRADAASGWPR